MDQSRFQEAQQAYDAGDFRSAAKGFLAAAGRGPEGNGAAYHMAGNALIRLRRYQDAVTVYGHALRDQIYDRRGAVFANLGAAYASIGEYVEAVKAYENALAEPDYATPYKAFQGMASALLERGRVEDAAVAYRKAALDPGNPDPGKALLNLGLCFMGLDRPGDAAEAYRAALGFEEYKGRGKALANLGQAYVAMGEYEEAVRAFEKATQLHNHQLSTAASAAYQIALQHARPAQRQVEEGWETGELPHVALPDDGSSADWATQDFVAVAAAAAHVPAASLEASAEPVAVAAPEAVAPAAAPAPALSADSLGGLPPEAEHAASALGFGDEEAIADFFSATEEELKVRDREARRAKRAEHGGSKSGVWAIVWVSAIVIVVLAGVLGGAYAFGLGWPTQQQTVGGMLAAHGTGGAVDQYWVAVPNKDIAKEMAKIPPLKTYTVDGVEMHARTSTVAVTVTPNNGAPLHYTVTLSREGVGWKVTGVDNDWRSTGG